MRFLAAVSAVFLFLFLTVSTPAFSQEDKDRAAQQEDKSKDKDKEPNKSDRNREQPRRDSPGAQQAQPAQHDQSARQDQDRREESRPDARQENHQAQQQDQDRENRARNNNNNMRQEQEERREQGQLEHADHDQHRVEGRRVERIPDDRFRASFGREHRFHVDRDRVYSQPQPVVVYGGYSFQLVDAWPRDWSFDDDCYVDYYDGQYWLYDANRPGMRIAVVVLEGY